MSDWRKTAVPVSAGGGASSDWRAYAVPVNAGDIEEVMHPELGIERAAIKNLSNKEEGNQQNAEYIKSRHPELDVRSYEGRIVAKSPGDEKWQVLDPDTGMFSADIGRDVLDMGTDLASGAVEGVATGVGGLVGGIPGASALAATAGGGTEGLRQLLGKWAGVNKEVDPADVATSAAISGAFPVGGKFLSSAGAGFKNKLFAPLMSFFSGTPKDAIETTMKRLPEVDQLDADGVMDYAANAFKKLSDPLWDVNEKTGKQLAQEIENAGGTVNIREAKEQLKVIMDRLEMLRAQSQETGGLNNKKLQEAVDSVRRIYYNHFFRKVTKKVPNQNPPKMVTVEVEDMVPDGVGGKYLTKVKKQIPDPNYKDEVLKEIEEEIPDELSPTLAWELQKQLRHTAKQHAIPSEGQGLMAQLRGFISKRTEGDTVAGKQTTIALDKGVDSISEGFDNITNGMTKELRDKYKAVSDLRRILGRHFNTPQKTYDTLRNRDAVSKTALREAMEKAKKLDPRLNIDKEVELLKAHRWMGDGAGDGMLPYFPISSNKVTSTARTLLAGGLGADIGGGIAEEFDPSLEKWGAGAGLILGNMAISPRAVKKYIRMMNTTGKAFTPKSSTLRYGLMNSAWDLMQNDPNNKEE